jgi:uncharacterized membrane protein
LIADYEQEAQTLQKTSMFCIVSFFSIFVNSLVFFLLFDFFHILLFFFKLKTVDQVKGDLGSHAKVFLIFAMLYFALIHSSKTKQTSGW